MLNSCFMKRSLLRIFILLLIASGAHAQTPLPAGTGWVQITNPTPFPSPFIAYGSTSVQVGGFPLAGVGTGSPANVPACSVPPAANTQYVLGSGVCELDFSFSKNVHGIFVHFDGLNTGEIIKTWVNFPQYSLTGPGNFTQFNTGFTSCFTCAPGGPCTLFTNPGLPPLVPPFGEIHGPTGVTGAACNGGAFEIDECTGLRTFRIQCNGAVGGITFSIFMDTTKPKGCSNAVNNNPCEGDTLKLGDSLFVPAPGYSYYWYGPYGFTSTLQNPFKYPALLTDSGLYTVVLHGPPGILDDTDTTYVHIHPKPYLTTISDNTPLCASPKDTLKLMTTGPSVAGETWMWTGPGFFTSTLQNPMIYGFSNSDTGLYTVTTLTPFGCHDSGTVYAYLQPSPLAPAIFGPSPYCYNGSFVPFTVTLDPGASALWYTTTMGGVGSTLATTINTDVAGSTKVFVSQIIGYCESPRDSITIVVLPRIDSNFTWKVLLGCDSDLVTFTNTSTNYLTSAWVFDEGNNSYDTFITQHTFLTHRVHPVTLTLKNAYGCPVSVTGYVNTTHSINPAFILSPPNICIGTSNVNNSTMVIDNTIIKQPDGYLAGLTGSARVVDTLRNHTDTTQTPPTFLGANYTWNFADGFTDVTNTRKPAAHQYVAGGTYRVLLTVTDSLGCVDTLSHPVNVLQLSLQNFHDTTLCISQPLPLAPKLVFLGNPPFVPEYALSDYPYSWNPGTYLSDSNSQTPFYTYQYDAVTTYTITVTNKELGCYASDTMRIHSVRGVKLANVTTENTIYYGNSIQLNSDSEVLYVWRPDNGTLNNANINNPVATPLETTTYTVFGYDRHGCLDSAYVIIHVDSTMNESIPSAFTPNGDGLNDVFRPVGIKFQSTVDFRVYNRLGTQVFYSNSYKNGWDGTYQGQPQDLGTYFYVIIVARPGGDGENVIYKGTVTLIR